MVDTPVIDSRNTTIHKPCAHNPNGADKEMCERLSGMPVRAVRCEDSSCESPWRVKGVVPAKAEIGFSTAETMHRLNLTRAAPEKPSVVQTPISSEEDSGEWRSVLERVKVAMANSVLVSIDPARIRPMPGQPREFFNEQALGSLRQSIKKVGQIQAGIVRAVSNGVGGVTHELLDGERRWRAVCLENIDFFRAQLVEIDDEAAPYMIAAIANFNREGHTPVEVSDAIHKLRTGPIKVPMKAIAEIFGFSEVWTHQMHGLQNLHDNVRALLDPNQPKEKILPVTAAVQISKLEPELQYDLAKKVLNKEISINRLRNAVVAAGEAHGKPVRTRILEPRKVLSSFERRCSESSRIAGDLFEQIQEMRSRGIAPDGASPRSGALIKALEAAIRDLSMVRDALKG